MQSLYMHEDLGIRQRRPATAGLGPLEHLEHLEKLSGVSVHGDPVYIVTYGVNEVDEYMHRPNGPLMLTENTAEACVRRQIQLDSLSRQQM